MDQQQQQQQQQFYQYHLQSSQPYNPSQVQAYDLSAQAYYTYNQDQQYGYYPQPYATDYQNQQQSTSIHPPGVPIPPEPTHTVGPDYAHLQAPHNAYYPQGVHEQQQQQQHMGYPDSAQAGSNLLQMAGNMDAAQGSVEQWQVNNGGFGPGPVRPPIGQSPYRGGGRRGGRPFRGGGRSFRGGGRGQFGPHGFGPDGSGRGQGGGRYFPPHNAVSTPNLGSVPTAEGPGLLVPGEASQLQGKTPQAFMQPLSGSDPGQAQFPAMAQHANPFWRSPCMAWCELCRVDCNTLEILEQHKNGKRHKKNLQVYQELQNLNKLITGVQNEQMPISDFKPQVIQPERVGGSEDKQPSQGIGANGTEKVQQTEVEKAEVSAQPTEEQERKVRMDHFQAPGRGLKRKMRGGRGGKRMRQFEPPKPKEMIPLICELCNVKCESQVVFESHLAGKKHHSNLKRFHGYQAIIAGALQALIPSNPNAPSNFFIPQVHQQGASGSQGFPAQPMPYMLPGQAPGMAPGHASEPEPVSALETLETQDKEGTKTVGSQATSAAGSQNTVTTEANSQLQPLMMSSEASSVVSTNTTIVSETSAFEGKDVIPPVDNLDVAPLENKVKGAEQVPSTTPVDTADNPDAAPSENKIKRAEQVLSTTPADKAVAVPE